MGLRTGALARLVSPAFTRLLGLIPALATTLITWYFLATGAWRLVGVWPEPARYVADAPTNLASFADLAYLTAVADCMSQGVDFTTCDPYGRPFQPYGVVPGSILNAAGLGLGDTGWLGTALAVMWIVLIGVLGLSIAGRWRGPLQGLLAAEGALTLIAVSPPALLGIERGQFEILIITLTCAGLALVTKPTRLLRSAGGALALTVSVILKYLSIGAFAAFLAPGRWRWWGVAAGFTSVGFLALNVSDLALARETARADQASTTRVMFSSTTALVTLLVDDPLAFAAPLEYEINDLALKVIGVVIFLVLVAIWWLALRYSPLGQQVRESPDVSWNLVIGGGFALIVPYFLGASNDYRLMFLVVPMTGALMWIGENPVTTRALWLMVLLMVVSALPAASMIPNESGFIMPEPVVVAGDLALAAALAGITAIFLLGWRRSPHTTRTDR